ncbi:hypothetical protein [Desulfocurvus sp. DL9XJH121]
MTECLAFLDQWAEDPNEVKSLFVQYKDLLGSCEGVGLSFKARPGISYSLRGTVPGNGRDLFVMVDVVDDDPADRWLSVCFYDDQVSDPDDLGDWAPEGLAGQDARCFSVDCADAADMAVYVEARIREAYAAARAV